MIIPDEYREMGEKELKGKIASLKKKWGKDLHILGHYYQRDEVIEFADELGDSFVLAKAGSETSAKMIVFCGVHFMAEASVVLAKPGQRVFLPDMDAGCPLADFATIDRVDIAWNYFEKLGIAKDLIPITYMNSSAAIKSFCGTHGGTVCTSSSAVKAFEFATSQGKKIFFLPDENLGRNAAMAKGVSPEDVALYDPAVFEDSQNSDIFSSANVIVWRGHCHVHTLFNLVHVQDARDAYPGCKVVVHPECTPDVVALADGNGSTAYLKDYVENSSAGSTVVVGTEINMVSRLAKQHPDKTIVPLARSLCPNMFKISLSDLCWTLDRLGDVNEVFVEDEVISGAKLALERMLSL